MIPLATFSPEFSGSPESAATRLTGFASRVGAFGIGALVDNVCSTRVIPHRIHRDRYGRGIFWSA